MNRWIVSCLIAALCSAGAFAQSSFPDVPERHWAGDAVERLADLGIVVGFPDGTYRGDLSHTRYEAALMFDRFLDVVGAELDALDAALVAESDVLREAIRRLAEENSLLREHVMAHREAVETLWSDIAELRSELGLPPPAPLPPLPDPLSSEREEEILPESGPADRPGIDAAEGDAQFDVADDAAGSTDVPGATQTADGAREDPAPAAEATGATAAGPSPYAGLGFGVAVPPQVLFRAVVGVDDVLAPRLGARVSLDVGRRAAAPMSSVSLMGHVTYRFLEQGAWDAYGGAGLGVQLAGEGPFVGLLAGGSWAVTGPLRIFAEATLDVYLGGTLPSGGPRVAPTLVMGGRWHF